MGTDIGWIILWTLVSDGTSLGDWGLFFMHITMVLARQISTESSRTLQIINLASCSRNVYRSVAAMTLLLSVKTLTTEQCQ